MLSLIYSLVASLSITHEVYLYNIHVILIPFPFFSLQVVHGVVVDEPKHNIKKRSLEYAPLRITLYYDPSVYRCV